MSKFVLISKDAMCTDYLPVYGNKQWKTPNIDALAEQGTVFTRHYTAAPSTVMSFYAMATGTFAHETKYELYQKIHEVYQGETIFTKLKDKGFKCHLVWNEEWEVLFDYYDYYRDDVEVHSLHGLRQGVGSHYVHDGFLQPDDSKAEQAFQMTSKVIKDILDSDENVFLWVHFPHVFYGRVSYGSDIELLDRYVGMIRELVPDHCIAFTADHGNENEHKGKISYGFDAYQGSIRIPLITPRIGDYKVYNQSTSSIDLLDLIFGTIPERKFVYSDTAYRAQRHRKLAIMYKNFKYIYNKKGGKEELYDLDFDPTEEFSIIDDYIYDVDRKINAPSRELYYYPDWDKLPEIRKIMRAEKARIWKNGSLKVVIKSNVKDVIRPFYVKLKMRKI